ncbi:MAG: UDP-N-acetylmuramoyl-L-alanine--D-glutamate ligase [Polyangiaceae bacterium]|nr:UDP-N-acetylmuramoyl-L-alanine--D-glutamate ligase [Polyangiaceae bacterium]MCW5790680.1 UDP-N-acetylmuramoyl-L-alanine--D-glutamate ligase [Polyangiaceae bacterium]
MQLTGRRVLVIGLGRSGRAAAALCLARGAYVTVSDVRAEAALRAELAPLTAHERLSIVSGPLTEPLLADADLAVVSPGVPPQPVLTEAEARGLGVIGELELAARDLGARQLAAPILAVGGTNGKSTTTTLLAALIAASGARVFAGGNLGQPLSEIALEEAAYDALVVEVSSFQLERIDQFHPRVSLLLNVSADHLDRYPSYEHYVAAKGNSFVRQGPNDHAVIPLGDAPILEQARRGAGRLVTFGVAAHGATPAFEARFGAEPVVIEHAAGQDTSIWAQQAAPHQGAGARSLEETEHVYSLAGVDLHGAHNVLNAAAAIAAARALGIDRAAITAGLRAFRGLPHRMQRVATVGGVTFYDDSKGTNVGAAVTAVLGLSEARCVLIAGGRDKQGSYAPLAEALAQRGRAAVLIGEAAPLIAAALGDEVPQVRAGSLQEAVQMAHSLAHPGDAVLLSPACSSFDMFTSYHERGVRFAEAVTQLSASLGGPA